MSKGKSEYWLSDEGLTMISGWARDGLTDEDIAHNIGVACSTLYVWKKRYPEISEALKRAKDVADRLVENALFMRATGYEKEAFKTFIYRGEAVVIPVIEHISPDTTAAIFWLKNRKPTAWRDKPLAVNEQDHETGIVILPEVLLDD